jgi:hypothetical protein
MSDILEGAVLAILLLFLVALLAAVCTDPGLCFEVNGQEKCVKVRVTGSE